MIRRSPSAACERMRSWKAACAPLSFRDAQMSQDGHRPSGHSRRGGQCPPCGSRQRDARMTGFRHALRSLRREWRLPELRTLIAALLLAVLALGTVGTLSSRVERAVLMSAAEVIGGDMGVNAATPLPDAFVQHAQALGLQTSHLANFPSVAFANQHSQLLEVVAGDARWPLRGKLVILGARGHDLDTHAPPQGEVFLDHRALVALGLRVGERVQLGGRDLRIAAQLQREPDGGDLFALAPRAVMALADAQAAGLLGTGSRAHHRLLVAGDPSQVDAYREWAKA